MLDDLAAYRRARRHGLPVTLSDVLAIRFRKGKPAQLIDAVVTARLAGVDYTLAQAETHALAGGDPGAIADAAATLRRRGEPADVDHLFAIDICRLDVRKLVERGVDISRLPGGDDPGPEFRIARP